MVRPSFCQSLRIHSKQRREPSTPNAGSPVIEGCHGVKTNTPTALPFCDQPSARFCGRPHGGQPQVQDSRKPDSRAGNARGKKHLRPSRLTSFSSELPQRPASKLKATEKIRDHDHIWPCATGNEPLSSAPRRQQLVTTEERWQSGLMHRTRNAAWVQVHRGFESLPLRHFD